MATDTPGAGYESDAEGKRALARSRRQRYERTRSQLTLERSSFLKHWQELNDYLKPRRARFYTSDVNRGNRRSDKIIDSTATFALRTLSSGMMAGITSPARPWFRLAAPQPELRRSKPVQDWLHETTERMQGMLAQTNIYNKLPTMYTEMGGFGTSALGIFPDDEDVIRAESFPIGSYMVSNNARGVVDTFYREFRMTVRQMLEKFGGAPHDRPDDIDWSRFSPRIKQFWERGDLEVWVDVCHVIEPNQDHRPGAFASRYKRYLSVYYETGNLNDIGKSGWDSYLEERGYELFPVLVGRWELTGEDTYATDCPGMTVLGDVKQLQLGQKRMMQAIEKMVTPPVSAPNQLRNRPLSMLPGGVTYYDVVNEKNGVRPLYEVDPRIGELGQMQEQTRDLIRRGLYEDLFLMLAQSDRREITAREVDERSQEKLLVLGPMLEQLNKDVLANLIDLSFFYMQERHQIPDPPRELEGAALQVDYLSLVAQAQKQVAIPAMEHFMGVVVNVAAVIPEILDKVNSDEWVAELGDATGVPPKMIRPDDEVAQIRDARAKQAQAAQAAATAKDAAGAVQSLANANTAQPSALTDIASAASGMGPINPFASGPANPAAQVA